jgi:hypothetical protein
VDEPCRYVPAFVCTCRRVYLDSCDHRGVWFADGCLLHGPGVGEPRSDPPDPPDPHLPAKRPRPKE